VRRYPDGNGYARRRFFLLLAGFRIDLQESPESHLAIKVDLDRLVTAVSERRVLHQTSSLR
jgi:hypothetical protein